MPHCPAVSQAAPGSIKSASLAEFTEKPTGMDIGQIATSQGRAYLSDHHKTAQDRSRFSPARLLRSLTATWKWDSQLLAIPAKATSATPLWWASGAKTGSERRNLHSMPAGRWAKQARSWRSIRSLSFRDVLLGVEQLGMEVGPALLTGLDLLHNHAMRLGVGVVTYSGDLPGDFHARFASGDLETIAAYLLCDVEIGSG
jgi:hypothetical protein